MTIMSQYKPSADDIDDANYYMALRGPYPRHVHARSGFYKGFRIRIELNGQFQWSVWSGNNCEGGGANVSESTAVEEAMEAIDSMLENQEARLP